jgi:GGDEF domain-containing protein
MRGLATRSVAGRRSGSRAERRPSAGVLTLAAVCSTGALLLSASGSDLLAVVAATAAFAAIASEMLRMGPWQHDHTAILGKIFAQAQAGRRLAIYDRDTGLFAHWYMSLRGQEECARAARYDRKLGLLMVEPHADTGAQEWALKAEIGRWMQTELRHTDIAGYLGNSRFVVLAPEADTLAIEKLVDRLRARIPDVDVGYTSFPDDGVTLQQLWRGATMRLADPEGQAA